ncbi:MAG: DUF4982 domain-containing protein [Ignavibacteriales bacterium]|nr:DUF4982 domain-containing protein [Ignavibacteriales bacterium]
MKKKFIVLLTLLPVLLAAQRVDRLINNSWKFTRENPRGASAEQFDDSRWAAVSLPHTWNALDGQDGGNDYYRGTGWYRRTLAIDSKYRNKSILLKFDGASTVTNVFVNGKLVTVHYGSFGAFAVDISNAVRLGGTNTIAVSVNNAKDTTVPTLRGDFTIFGGLYRDVHLIVTEKICISPLDHASTGVYVQQLTTNDVSLLTVTTKVRNTLDRERKIILRTAVKDALGKAVTTTEEAATVPASTTVDVQQQMKIPSPHLWNGRKDPYLYTLSSEVVESKKILDAVTQQIGLRYYAIDASTGLTLNGSPLRLNGVNRHQDRENMGWAITAKEHDEDIRIIGEIGANAIRLAHYQHAQHFYDLCDQKGFIVWAEHALVDDIAGNEQFVTNCKEQLTELIKQNYNHPSIFFWSLENELIPDENRDYYTRVVSELNALAKKLDPTRSTAVATRSKYKANEGINSQSDVLGINVYRGWYESKPEDFSRYIDTVHAQVPSAKLCISEYGAGGAIDQHEYPAKKPNPRGPWHPEEWQSILHEATWMQIAQRPYLWGSFVWNMFDFASDGRAEGNHFGRNDKGLVSYDRTVKKDAFYWYKANWNPEPMVYITSRRYSPRPLTMQEVKVYSNCESVELFLNGKSQGRKKSSGKMFQWDSVQWKEQENTIAVVGTSAGNEVEDRCVIIALPMSAADTKN